MNLKRLISVYDNPDLLTPSEIEYAEKIIWRVICCYFYLNVMFLTFCFGKYIESVCRMIMK